MSEPGKSPPEPGESPPERKKSPWNTLEATRVGVSLLTPIVLAVVGWFVQHSLSEQNRLWEYQLEEQRQMWKSSERLVERRMQVYDSIRRELNRIYCFVEDVGTWKQDNPETVIGYKRIVDEAMHSQRAFWSPDTFAAYLDYMDAAFAEYQGGVGADAPIRTTDREKRVGIPDWEKKGWADRITQEKDREHKVKYEQLMQLISRDLMISSATSSRTDEL